MFTEVIINAGWLNTFFQMPDTIIPAFDAESIIWVCKISIDMTINILIILGVCWVVSQIPRIDNSRILIFMLGLIGIVWGMLFNSITGRMTDIELTKGAILLMLVLSIGLFLPREQISELIKKVGKIGIALPLQIWIFAGLYPILQIPDLFCWGVLITTIILTGYLSLPTKWKLSIMKTRGFGKAVASKAVITSQRSKTSRR